MEIARLRENDKYKFSGVKKSHTYLVSKIFLIGLIRISPVYIDRILNAFLIIKCFNNKVLKMLKVVRVKSFGTLNVIYNIYHTIP